MEQVCHRCGATINSSDPFCPHCGAPQLRFEKSEEAALPENVPSTHRLTPRDPNAIHWRDAVLVAALVALPTGVLSALLGLEAMWGVAGGMALISLYRRRTSTLPTGKMGWRIGALLGIFASLIAVITDAVTLLIQRFALHQGPILERRYHDLGQQLADQLTRSNPDAAAVLPGFLHFWLTPDGAAAMVLINAAGLALFMLVFSAAGGAIGARFTRKITQRTTR